MKLLTNSKALTEQLKKISVERSEDLIEYLPYRYESFEYTDEEDVKDRQRIVILGRLVSNPRLYNKGKISLITFHFISVNRKFYSCKMFNRAFYYSSLDLESSFTLTGILDLKKKELNVVSLKKGEIPDDRQLKPVYHLPTGVSSSVYLGLVRRTLERIDEISGERLPSYLIRKYRLMSHNEALKVVHFPKSREEIAAGLRTVKFEECLEYCMKNRIIRIQNKKLVKSSPKPIDTQAINRFILALPYKLTKDQTQAIREIVLDLMSPSLMYRLLQGDVGSGKTIVGIVSLYANFLRGKQGVLLAPTDSLARQHYENVRSVLEPYGIRCCLLIGDLKAKEKEALKEKVASGKEDVIVGTHSVFSKTVTYAGLGLAIIDEQHRFGVNQRNLLENKGDDVDLLLMSATPIPRTLALSIYGDLDVSSLTTFPSGEHRVTTRVVGEDSAKILSLIEYCLEESRQVFIVCPKIAMGNSMQSSEEIYAKFAPVFGEKIALLHGKMPNEEKVSVLDKFKRNEIGVLVSTTLIELGIDIPSAGGMIIYSANSFGLASLHQLRGRVGRDGREAYCLLVERDPEEEDCSRLKFLETCTDGFEIAEEDMRRRGPGDFIGIQQSGFPSFNSLNIVKDFRMFETARNEADAMLKNPDDPEVARYYRFCLNRILEKEKSLLLDGM